MSVYLSLAQARYAPPPWAQQSPCETAVFVQPSPLQFLPPPCVQHTPRDLARLSHPGTVHLVEPPARPTDALCWSAMGSHTLVIPTARPYVPCFQQTPRFLALLVQPVMAHRLPP